MTARFPRWYLPDQTLLLDSLPRSSVGKVDKKALRERFRDHLKSDPDS